MVVSDKAVGSDRACAYAARTFVNVSVLVSALAFAANRWMEEGHALDDGVTAALHDMRQTLPLLQPSIASYVNGDGSPEDFDTAIKAVNLVIAQVYRSLPESARDYVPLESRLKLQDLSRPRPKQIAVNQ